MTSLPKDKNIQSLVDKIPLLANATITKLEGGLTNTNYRIQTPFNKYVMRVSDPSTKLLGINRDNERVNTTRAHLAGVGAAVAATLPEDNALLVHWIEAVTLHASDFKSNKALLPRIAEALKLLHTAPVFQGTFYFPDIRKKYLQIVLHNHYFLPDLYLSVEPLVMELEKRLAADQETLVSCNNDLLAENFMDDGKKIWIIDYEYAGMNEASFEIGNLASETGLNDEELTTLCEVYWGQHLPSKIARAKAWSMIARYGWVLWASIQEAISTIDFDFRTWGMKKWNSVLPELQGESYNNIIKQLKK